MDPAKITSIIALFDDVAWIRAALIHLLQIGFDPSQILLATPEQSFADRLSGEWKPLPKTIEGQDTAWLLPAIGVDTENTQILSLQGRVQEHILSYRDWLIPDFVKQLEHEFSQGAAVLFAATEKGHQVSEGCEALLRYTNRDVQTHEHKLS